ncbi:MAG TPA: hypothetical protein EYQ64_10890 [Gemmatimonadetes bacterium]|nr:hypothetical protein [Gemmatimonadota bacterium]
MVNDPALFFFFDYVDPGSYLVHRQLDLLLADGVGPILHPFEVRPVPQELMDATDPEWIDYGQIVADHARESKIELSLPSFIPWSRKAHELRLHAAEHGLAVRMHEELFSARFEEGVDIGRVDLLVATAERIGLDTSEAKAVLDIDKYRDRIVALRVEAEAEGVRSVPTLRSGTVSLEGPPSMGELRQFLRDARLI